MFRLVFWGLVVHVVLLISIFEIHFKSPVLENVEPVINNVPAPAKRVVLFSGDGIRADTFFSLTEGRSTSSFLRSIIETFGMWGISHAHVPTESRPGHVAILAGMYEDPSAIFKGWQNYIVDFDSVFNRSYASFSWGSPDILDIFSRGSIKENFFNFKYDPNSQQFSGTKNSSEALTYWVADQFDLFVNNLKFNSSLADLFASDKTFLFFHFLGTDTAGHTNKPHSEEYINNVLAVDKCVRRIYNILSKLFHDDRTAFIFTSDHGMTDWGSHGDGTPEETLTPIVTWGAGLSPPKLRGNDNIDTKNLNPDVPTNWGLSKFLKFDINQADITPLISVLLGIEIPVNSVGVLPIDFLSGDLNWLLNAVQLNIDQLKSQFVVRRNMIESNVFDCFFKNFPEPNYDSFYFSISKNVPRTELNRSVDLLFALYSCQEYIKGIDYYRNYFSTFLLSLMSFMYFGWMFFVFIEIISNSKISKIVFNPKQSFLKRIWTQSALYHLISGFIIVATLFLLSSQYFPLTYYIYCFMTIGLWHYVVFYMMDLIKAMPVVNIKPAKVVCFAAMFLIGLSLLALCFQTRGYLSIAVLCLNLFWLIEEGSKFNWHSLFCYFLLTSIALAVFPLLPTIGTYASFILLFQSSGFSILYCFASASILESIRKSYAVIIQLSIIILAGVNILIVTHSFELKLGLSLSSQIVSWSLSGISLGLLLFHPRIVQCNYLYISHCLSVPYLLLSNSHEGLFLCILSFHLFLWVYLEHYGFTELKQNSYELVSFGPKTLKYSDFRIAYFFLCYSLYGFFGIGNMASLNSFDPSWVRGFITTFYPFTMMALIIFKIIIPIFIVVTAVRAIILTCRVSTETIFSCVLLFCGVIGLHFFLTVTNEGSWLEIGSSLSRFIIIELLTILLLVFYGLSTYLMPGLPGRKKLFVN